MVIIGNEYPGAFNRWYKHCGARLTSQAEPTAIEPSSGDLFTKESSSHLSSLQGEQTLVYLRQCQTCLMTTTNY